MRKKLPIVLTIAGSDSGGGAGIQADIKTFQRMGVFGASAITCITAQNPGAVLGISAVSPKMVALQITAVCEAFHVAAAKTGMLYSARIINAVADALESAGIPALVVDPVMVATSGARLLRGDAVRVLCLRILPLARVITPNVPEAEALCGSSIRTMGDMKAAARAIGERFGAACVVKGGHLPGSRAVDVLFDPCAPSGEDWERIYSAGRIRGTSTHGTGCMFSAALAACLARGEPLAPSVGKAKRFVRATLTSPPSPGPSSRPA